MESMQNLRSRQTGLQLECVKKNLHVAKGKSAPGTVEGARRMYCLMENVREFALIKLLEPRGRKHLFIVVKYVDGDVSK